MMLRTVHVCVKVIYALWCMNVYMYMYTHIKLNT